jgi:hypothetical protein
MFLKLIGESSVLSLKARNAITKSYNRPYAALIEEDIMTGLLTKYHSPDASRRMEWNFNSEMNGTGLEWRSPNMREISTWKEFDEFFIILAKCVKYFVENALTYSIEKEKDYVVSVPNCNIQKGIFYFDETKSKRPDTMFYQHNYDDIMVVNIATKTRTRKTVSF